MINRISIILITLLFVGIGCTSTQTVEPVGQPDEQSQTQREPRPREDRLQKEVTQETETESELVDDAIIEPEPVATSSSAIEFFVDGKVMEAASNPGAKMDDDGNVLLLFEDRDDSIQGNNGIAMATASSDWLDFEVIDENADVGAFRAIELPDGTYRAYGGTATGGDSTKGSSPNEGIIGIGSLSSNDNVNFTEDEGYRYVLQDFDSGSMGVYDLFVDANDGVVLLYIGNMRGDADAEWGKNTVRRAYSTDGGWTFEFDRGYILGNENDTESNSYVDQKSLSLGNGQWRLITMRGGYVYSFISNDDGYSFVLEGLVFSPDDFSTDEYEVISLHDPVMVQLPDGRVRIYVTGTEDHDRVDPNEPPPRDKQHLFSATTK